MHLTDAALLAGASVVAGAINSVAGGGTLVSFPAAIAAGLSPIVANATNAVALAPGSLAAGWGYRREAQSQRALLRSLALPAAAGGLVGSVLLLVTPPKVFDAIVPWLVLAATLLVALKDLLAKPRPHGAPHRPRLALAIGCQLLVGIYGGYFGAGMGIVMLGFYAIAFELGIHEMNAVKSVLAALINGISSVYFVARGVVDPASAAIMAVGAIVGGLYGAKLARKAPQRVVRALVLAIGAALTCVLAYRRWG